jgi:hypothetical protein
MAKQLTADVPPPNARMIRITKPQTVIPADVVIDRVDARPARGLEAQKMRAIGERGTEARLPIAGKTQTSAERATRKPPVTDDDRARALCVLPPSKRIARILVVRRRTAK